jgi:hypothetical protein
LYRGFTQVCLVELGRCIFFSLRVVSLLSSRFSASALVRFYKFLK